jgi:hypothetical protein
MRGLNYAFYYIAPQIFFKGFLLLSQNSLNAGLPLRAGLAQGGDGGFSRGYHFCGKFFLEKRGFSDILNARGTPPRSEGPMETQAGETVQQPEEAKTPPPEQSIPPEEPIILKKLFPRAKQDLDALFPEPGMKKLLKDLVRTRQKNARFLKRVDLGEVEKEEEEEPAETP